MIKKVVFSIISLALIFSLVGCASVPVKPQNSDSIASSSNADNPSNTAEHKLSVVTTNFPPYDFVRQIAGDKVNLTMLLPPAAESHNYEPTPQDIITIQKCDVFIYVGGESETWVNGILKSLDTSKIKIISMMDLVEVVEEELKEGMTDVKEHDNDHEEGQNHTEEREYDEHVWTSPVNAIKITQALSETLSSLDKTNSTTYHENTEKYVAQLQAVDAEFRDIVKNAKRKTIVFGDRFPFRYFVDEYGLDYFAAFPGCASETEANAQTLAFLIDKVKEESIPVVFHIELSNEKMADTICAETGAKKLLFHSVHNVTKAEFENGVTYLDLVKQNAKNLKEALQ